MGFPGRKWELLLPDPGQGQHKSRAFREAPGRAVSPFTRVPSSSQKASPPARKNPPPPPTNPSPESASQEKDPCLLPREGAGERHFLSMASVGRFSESPFQADPVSEKRRKCLPCSILCDPARAGVGAAEQAGASCPPATKKHIQSSTSYGGFEDTDLRSLELSGLSGQIRRAREDRDSPRVKRCARAVLGTGSARQGPGRAEHSGTHTAPSAIGSKPGKPGQGTPLTGPAPHPTPETAATIQALLTEKQITTSRAPTGAPTG